MPKNVSTKKRKNFTPAHYYDKFEKISLPVLKIYKYSIRKTDVPSKHSSKTLKF